METLSTTPVPATPLTPPTANQPLPRPVVVAALVIAAGLPVVLLVTLISLMVASNYNLLNWME